MEALMDPCISGSEEIDKPKPSTPAPAPSGLVKVLRPSCEGQQPATFRRNQAVFPYEGYTVEGRGWGVYLAAATCTPQPPMNIAFPASTKAKSPPSKCSPCVFR